MEEPAQYHRLYASGNFIAKNTERMGGSRDVHRRTGGLSVTCEMPRISAPRVTNVSLHHADAEA